MIPRDELEPNDNPNMITTTAKQENNLTTTTTASWARSKDPRIVRVSRALGGKDRHSKVCTVRGLRDRRVRLSVPTAIQLYDLQDRLGLNQPSKVVDWLLNAAKHEIDELPPLRFPQGGLIGQNFQPITGFQDFVAPAKQGLIKDRASGETSSSNVGNDETGETRFNLQQQQQQQGELNDFLSRQKFSTNQNLATWEAPNLTLNHFQHHHPSIGLGLNAHHQNDQDSQNFGLNNQVFVYHHPQLPYFPQANTEFDPKQPSFIHDLSNTVRPFQFSMSTANLLTLQNNAVNEENKRDELH